MFDPCFYAMFALKQGFLLSLVEVYNNEEC